MISNSAYYHKMFEQTRSELMIRAIDCIMLGKIIIS